MSSVTKRSAIILALVAMIVGFQTTVSAQAATTGSASSAASSAATVAAIVSPSGEAIDPREGLILFHSEACIHCRNEIAWLETVRADFPDVPIHMFEIEVTQNAANQRYFAEVMEAYDSFPEGWPRTVIGERLYIGFMAEDGAPNYNDQYAAWLGYRNVLYRALERIQEGIVASR